MLLLCRLTYCFFGTDLSHLLINDLIFNYFRVQKTYQLYLDLMLFLQSKLLVNSDYYFSIHLTFMLIRYELLPIYVLVVV